MYGSDQAIAHQSICNQGKPHEFLNDEKDFFGALQWAKAWPMRTLTRYSLDIGHTD